MKKTILLIVLPICVYSNNEIIFGEDKHINEENLFSNQISKKHDFFEDDIHSQDYDYSENYSINSTNEVPIDQSKLLLVLIALLFILLNKSYIIK